MKVVLFDISGVTLLPVNLVSNVVKESGDGSLKITSRVGVQDGSEQVFIKINRLTEARLQVVVISILVSLTATQTSVFWVAVSFR